MYHSFGEWDSLMSAELGLSLEILARLWTPAKPRYGLRCSSLQQLSRAVNAQSRAHSYHTQSFQTRFKVRWICVDGVAPSEVCWMVVCETSEGDRAHVLRRPLAKRQSVSSVIKIPWTTSSWTSRESQCRDTVGVEVLRNNAVLS